MKLPIPAGCLFPAGCGKVNNKLRPEKFLSSCFRTGVRFPRLHQTKPSRFYGLGGFLFVFFRVSRELELIAISYLQSFSAYLGSAPVRAKNTEKGSVKSYAQICFWPLVEISLSGGGLTAPWLHFSRQGRRDQGRRYAACLALDALRHGCYYTAKVSASTTSSRAACRSRRLFFKKSPLLIPSFLPLQMRSAGLAFWRLGADLEVAASVLFHN